MVHHRRLAGFSVALTLHLICVSMLVWLSLPETAPAANRPSTAAAVTPVAPATSETAPPTEAQVRDDIGKYLPSPPSVRVWGFQFDVRKIRARWSALFPFVTAPPSFDAAPRLQLASSRVVFVDPQAPPPVLPPAKPVLTMSRAAIQQLMDRTWARRDRWSHFAEFVKLAGSYHPNDGRLPSVIRAWVEQNSLQPYEDTTLPDPRRWAMLALAADHQDFVDFIARYVREHPGTRTATEMLFLVDALMQGSRETLVLLLETSPQRHMAWTRTESYEAYVLFGALREYYGAYLDKRGLGTSDAIRQKYDALRLQVLSTVLRVTPQAYRAGDAQFLIGAIKWAQDDLRGAVNAWREMRVAADDRYVEPASQILRVLHGPSESSVTPGSDTAARIRTILAGERRKWTSFQFDRLRQFGHAFSTF
jgi:hypothetical protein